MSGTKRRLGPGVAQRLREEPHRFQFFQSIRVLEHVFARQGIPLDDVVPRRLHFRNTLSLSFPASEIEQLQVFDQDGVEITGQALDSDVTAAWRGVDIRPAFIGMLGLSGTLPLGYTERIGEREVFHRDHAARAFMDIFNNRAVALFYAGWKKYRLALQYELDRKERFLPLALSLAGLGMKSMRSRLAEGKGAVFDQALAYYSAAVRQRPLSAAFLQRILTDYFEMPVTIEQFVGAWYPVPASQVSRLGSRNAVLGHTALTGERVWQRDLRVGLKLGPLSKSTLEHFLPGASGAQALAKWLTLLGGGSLEYQVNLVLRAEDVCSAGLNEQGGARLGWDSFVATRPAQEDRAVASYLVRTLQ